MIKEALAKANSKINPEKINICSICGGKTFADRAVEATIWTAQQGNGLYNMDDLCNGIS